MDETGLICYGIEYWLVLHKLSPGDDGEPYIDLSSRSDGGEHAPTTAPEVNAVTAISPREVMREIKSQASLASARFTLAPAAR
jgi:hypothetical protein